jgi:hypothetical protein
MGQRVQAGLVKDPELFAVINADDHAIHGTIVDIMDKIRSPESRAWLLPSNLSGGARREFWSDRNAPGFDPAPPAGVHRLSMVGGSLRTAAPPPNLIPTEMLVEPPPPVMAEPVPPPEPDPLPPQTVEQPEPVPPPAPEPQPVTPPRLAKVIPPKLVEKPMPERVAPRLKPLPPVPRVRLREPASPPPGKPQSDPSGAPLPTGAQAAAGGNVMGPPAERPPEGTPQPVEGGEAAPESFLTRGT